MKDISEIVNTTLHGNAYDRLKHIPSESVDCCVTSPPYWGLRDYGLEPTQWPECHFTVFGMPMHIPAQTCCLGLEESPYAFVAHIVLIFEEVRRILKPQGTLWINFGDSYASGKIGRDDQKRFYERTHGYTTGKQRKTQRTRKKAAGIKHKNLIGIPWMVAFALREAGWYLRQDIIWSKPNGMPESVKDRCTKAHEYIFLLSKQKKYYFDQEAIKTPIKDSSIARLIQDTEQQKGSERVSFKTNGTMKAVGRKPRPGVDTRGGNQGSGNIPVAAREGTNIKGHSGYFNADGKPNCGTTANKRSVWHVSTAQFKEAHFAVFPESLIVDAVKAGCPDKGIVMDPFIGSHTTAITAIKNGKKYIGIEMSEKYIDIGKNRMIKELGLFCPQ